MYVLHTRVICFTQFVAASTVNAFFRATTPVTKSFSSSSFPSNCRKQKIKTHETSSEKVNSRLLCHNDAWEKWEFGDEDSILAVDDEESIEKVILQNETMDYDGAYSCLEPFLSDERKIKMGQAISCRSGKVRYIFEDPINLSNVWACLRTLDSFGIQNVDVITNPSNYLNGDTNIRYKTMRAAMGTQKWMSIHQHSSSDVCISNLKEDGWVILGTDLEEGAKDITEQVELFNEFEKYAIVMGNEERGISEEMRQLCDHRIYLPMRGFAQSFSLSVGCAAITSHLNTCNALKLGSLAGIERSKVKYQWALKSVKGSRAILRRNGFDIDLYPRRSNVMGYKTK